MFIACFMYCYLMAPSRPQALTVANELLYNGRVRGALAECPGLPERLVTVLYYLLYERKIVQLNKCSFSVVLYYVSYNYMCFDCKCTLIRLGELRGAAGPGSGGGPAAECIRLSTRLHNAMLHYDQ